MEKASTALFLTGMCLLFLGMTSYLGSHTKGMQDGIKSYVLAHNR